MFAQIDFKRMNNSQPEVNHALALHAHQWL